MHSGGDQNDTMLIEDGGVDKVIPVNNNFPRGTDSLKTTIPAGGWPGGWSGGRVVGWVVGWLDKMKIRLISAEFSLAGA